MRPTLLVVERPEDWPPELAAPAMASPDDGEPGSPAVEVVSARSYLTEARWSGLDTARVFNLCRSYRYQSLGYYVSLLAAARDHRPLPSVGTIQDLKNRSLVRFVSSDLEELIDRSLASLASDEFVLSIYFGKNLAERHRRLALRLFNAFPAPLLRARFRRSPAPAAGTGERRWTLTGLQPIAAKDVPPEHREFVAAAAAEYFAGRRVRRAPHAPRSRYDLAILVNPKDPTPPSDERALQRFVRAARRLGLAAETIGPDDLGRLAEYDALFLRETTRVDHHTYRFARRAAAEGLVVIDDPDSILRCTNKVFLAERLGRAGLPTPRTVVLHRDNLEQAAAELGFPCVLKTPDGSFSLGVFKVDDADAFRARALELLERSELLVAQEFLPTEFDWRVGVLDGKPLHVCRYHMARGHWQIVARGPGGRSRYGRVETLAAEDAPTALLDTALAAAALVGDGLYGVDLKQAGETFSVIEVNDNPTLESGVEDAVLGDALWRRLAETFLERIERRKGRP